MSLLKKRDKIPEYPLYTPSSLIYRNEMNLQKTYRSWYQNPIIVAFVVTVLAISDFFTLSSLFNSIKIQEIHVSVMMTITSALILEIIPIILGRFYNDIRYRKSNAKIGTCIVLASAFFLLFAALFAMRISTRSILFAGGNDEIVFGSGNQTVGLDARADSSAAWTFTVFLGVLPLITSIAAFFLGYFSNDTYQAALDKLKLQKCTFNEAIIDLEVATEKLNSFSKETYIVDEENKYRAHVAELYSLEARLKAIARTMLEERIAEGSRISHISENAVETVDKINKDADSILFKET